MVRKQGPIVLYRHDTISLAKQNSQMMICLAHSVAVVFPTNIDVTAVFPTNIDVIVVFPPTIDEISPHHLLRSTKVLAGYFLK